MKYFSIGIVERKKKKNIQDEGQKALPSPREMSMETSIDERQ